MIEILNKKRTWINALLFVLTVGSVFFVGLNGSRSFLYGVASAPASGTGLLGDPRAVLMSVLYTLVLVAILLSHEMGHYLTCRRYRIEATLPYFIPAPSLVGTMGAFIRIKSPITRKNELFDIGAAGPLAGFIPALPALVVGLSLSRVVPAVSSPDSLILGEPLLMKIVSYLIFGRLPAGMDILLHPVAFAGWVGMLVTAFNLFPMGQLDGGHIFYTLMGRRAAFVTRLFLVIFVIMGVFFWVGWFVWALLILVLGVKHPRLLDEDIPLSPGRRVVGALIVVIFILSFIPYPVQGFNMFDLLKQLRIL
jgi:membrane-associated protease RseP (regulator of RpoE activity)